MTFALLSLALFLQSSDVPDDVPVQTAYSQTLEVGTVGKPPKSAEAQLVTVQNHFGSTV